MSARRRTLERILSGAADRNIRFRDLRQLLLNLGFEERIQGDHYIYSRDTIVEIINLQPGRGNMAKPYQVRQVRNIIVKYRLTEEIE